MPRYCTTTDKNGRILYWRIKPNGKRVRVRKALVEKSTQLSQVPDCSKALKQESKKTSKLPFDILESLPPEITTQLLLQTPYEDVLAACGTSRYMRALCSQTFWKEKARRDFPSKVPRNPKDLRVKTWKQVYQKLKFTKGYSDTIATYLSRRWGGYLGMSKKTIMDRLKNITITPKEYISTLSTATINKGDEIFSAVIPPEVWDEEKVPERIAYGIRKVLVHLHAQELGKMSKRQQDIHQEVANVLKFKE